MSKPEGTPIGYVLDLVRGSRSREIRSIIRENDKTMKERETRPDGTEKSFAEIAAGAKKAVLGLSEKPQLAS